VFLVAAALLAGVAAAAANDAPTGRVAFERRDGLYVETIGGTVTKIRGTKPGDGDPQYSPDGRSIAFDRPEPNAAPGEDGIPRDVWVMAADGSGRRQLTTSRADDGWPRWSPGGRSLAFYSYRREGGAYVLDVARHAAREVAPYGWLPDWTPDGRIVYSDPLRRIVTVSSYGRDPRLLAHQPGDAGEVHFSPDGGSLVYVEYEGSAMKVANADGSDARVLAEADQPDDASWSPDGSWIVYDAGDEDYADQFAIHPDGTGRTKINAVAHVCCASWAPPSTP
jgi:Tol biopolymer transport system component